MPRPMLLSWATLAVCATAMCVVSNVYLCLRGRPAPRPAPGHDEDDYFRHLMAQARPRPNHPPLPQRKLTHVHAQGRPRHVRLYDVHGRKPEGRDYHCVATKTQPSFHVCPYPPAVDRYISAALVSDGIWEPYITPIVQRALNKYPDAAFLDVGANLGYYTLLAARMGHHVVAVEPALENVRRLHQGAWLSGVTRAVDVVYGAVSDAHRDVRLSRSRDNQGGLWLLPRTDAGGHGDGGLTTTTMDHLLEVADFSQAVIKIDIEGHECRAMAGARRLLAKVYVPYIFMEWKKMYQGLQEPDTPCSKEAVERLTHHLTASGYVPYEVRTGFQLNPIRSTTRWRIGDVYWRRTDAKVLQDPF